MNSKKNPKPSSLNHRKDYRTTEEFAADIKTYTSIESFVMQKWVEEMGCSGHQVNYVDSGVDNDGELIGGTVGINFDFTINFIKKQTSKLYRLDVKHNYNDATATFKAHNLDNYKKHGIHMLLVIGTGLNGRELKPEEYERAWQKSADRRKWALISPSDIKIITDRVPCTKLKYMGNKLGFIIYKRQFDLYFDLKKFEYV